MTLVRFAPSPTGFLHVGNARPALLNWLFAAMHGGRFALRLDDTDRERSTEAFAAAIVEDLAWLGIAPHLTVRQSDRFDLYAAAAERLKAMGRLYPCYETPDELERRRRRQLARGLPPIYDRAALALDAGARRALEAAGRVPHWRFRLEARDTRFHDLVRGEVHVDAASLSDPVLIRADGTCLYTLPSVVDDAEMGVTHVIRGEDHVFNTGVQIQLFEALGAPLPVFAHHNLLTAATGEGLSKRDGALSLRSLRAQGIEPMAVASLAVLVGSAEEVHAYDDLAALAPHAGLDRISRAPARFDPSELAQLSHRLVHRMSHAAAAARLAAAGVGGGEAFWLAVRANLGRVEDAAGWWAIATGEIAPPVDADRDFLAAALRHLPAGDVDGTTWKRWTEALKAETGRAGKALFMPLRRALTGRDQGPDLAAFLPFIGRERILRRLS